MNHRFISLLLLGFAVLIVSHANARTPQKKKSATALTGTVIGTDGKPVPHAAVSCQSSGGVSPHAVHTDAKGKFMIIGLKQDSYDLRASANGANSDWHRNIPLRWGQTKDVTLHLFISTEPPATMPVKQPEPKP